MSDERCCKTVFHPHGPLRGSRCSRKAKVTAANGNRYCAIHDPVRVAAKAAERAAQWDRERAEKNARHAREEQTGRALEACKAACKAIASGHNNPRSLAAEALAKFP